MWGKISKNKCITFVYARKHVIEADENKLQNYSIFNNPAYIVCSYHICIVHLSIKTMGTYHRIEFLLKCCKNFRDIIFVVYRSFVARCSDGRQWSFI